jgi:hypothetical protein
MREGKLLMTLTDLVDGPLSAASRPLPMSPAVQGSWAGDL